MKHTDSTQIIIHGHFYQPPRENPWSGMIPRQPSAAPFHNWNHRVTAECYTANTSSRRLDAHGLIESIDNNFKGISFNIGPTLLAWMEKHTPDTYRRILEADQESVQRFSGHGNALAQAYNHTILPLAQPEDIRTQIRWGISDFRHRFGRAPEGMWLAETAINEQVIDILIEEGIHFTVLSPFQAASIRPSENEAWTSLKNGAPCDRAFTVSGSTGKLSLFFYHPGLASGISFQHYLRDADQLYKRFQNLSNQIEGNLISVATDGEIYGHHEPFGDMCLASLLTKFHQSEDLKITNWGEYLEKNPPVWQVKLHKGEDHRGTSWSCHHGVSRWYKDCHCQTGGKPGWNQKWRSPLRQGFENLHKELKTIYCKEAAALSSMNPDELRNLYGDVIVGAESREVFLKSYLLEPEDSEAGKKLLTLLEGQRFSQYMFTSCGWFFAELSGIEPVQNMKYAARAIELHQTFTKKNLNRLLSAYLEKAKGNIVEKGNGWEIYVEEALTDAQHITQTVAYFLFQEIYGVNKIHEQDSYHYHHLIIHRNEDDSVEGSISLELKNTQESFHFQFYLSRVEENFDILKIQETKDQRVFSYSITELPKEIRETIYRKKRKEDLFELKNYLTQSFSQLLTCYKDQKRILPEGDSLTLVTLESAITLTQAGILENAENQGLMLLDKAEVLKLDELFSLGKNLRLKMADYIMVLCSKIIADEVEYFLEYKNYETIEMLYSFIKILWKHKLSAVKPYTQNMIFQVFNRRNPHPWLKEFSVTKGSKEHDFLLDGIDKLSEIANIKRDVLITKEDILNFSLHG